MKNELLEAYVRELKKLREYELIDLKVKFIRRILLSSISPPKPSDS